MAESLGNFISWERAHFVVRRTFRKDYCRISFSKPEDLRGVRLARFSFSIDSICELQSLGLVIYGVPVGSLAHKPVITGLRKVLRVRVNPGSGNGTVSFCTRRIVHCPYGRSVRPLPLFWQIFFRPIRMSG